MSISIPESLTIEHEELHKELAQAIKAGGRTGEAARVIAERLHPHFMKEEEYALPPLGLLARLARGEPIADANEAVAMAGRLKVELPNMLADHQAIVAALRDLRTAAEAEHHPEVERFAEALSLHARTEEEVLYPAAILVGEVLKRNEGVTQIP